MKIELTVSELNELQKTDNLVSTARDLEFSKSEVSRLELELHQVRIHQDFPSARMQSIALAFSQNASFQNKIEAIKVVRLITGAGLKDAKEMVEGNVAYFATET